jgi:peptidoglycan hydrolase-like protein with peptidoglycan-binding domain
MRLLRYIENKPMTGPDVEAWQRFLISQLGLTWDANGVYGPKTFRATNAFQSLHAIGVDGKVGRDTLTVAKELGFVEPEMPESPAPEAPAPPAPAPSTPTDDPSSTFPNFPRPTVVYTEENFGGRYTYRDVPGSDEIVITDGWESRNLTRVMLPRLAGIPFYSLGNTVKSDGRMRFNKRATDQLMALWQAWDDAGLSNRIKTFGGAFNSRYRRKSARRKYLDLSNHAYGTAFDINIEWNAFGKTPAAMNKLGCVRELVQIANQFGFYWGGHYPNSKDGMHFEIGKLF